MTTEKSVAGVEERHNNLDAIISDAEAEMRTYRAELRAEFRALRKEIRLTLILVIIH